MKNRKKFVRIVCLVLAALMVLSLIPAIVLAADAGQTILFSNSAGWSSVYIYYWSSSNNEMTSWPGKPMQLLKDDIYHYDIPADAQYVIFNNGSGTQTADLTIPSGKNLYTYDTGIWSLYEDDAFCVHSYDAGTVTTAATCTAEGVMTYTCTKCGSTKTEALPMTDHTYSGRVCTVCGTVKPVEKSVFFDNAGNGWSPVYIYFWCDADTEMTVWPGETMAVWEGDIWTYSVPADTQYVIFHNGSGTQTADLTLPGNGYLYSGGSWTAYEVCSHSYGEGVVTTAPGCEAEGVMTYVCDDCGESRTEAIPATGHSYADGSCVVCGMKEECAEHTWDEGVVTQEATCWVAGSRTYTCTVCARTKTETIPGGHEFYVAEVIEPTCTKSGKQITKCTGCAYSADKTLPKIDHSYEIPGETVAATCTTDGYTVYACSGCGATQNGSLVYHTGHSWSGTTCTVCGEVCDHDYVDGICSACHDGGPAYVEGWYEISNAAQLRWFAAQVNAGNNAIHGRLIADIDLQGGDWTSIGYYASDTLEPDTVPYTGTFDGQGHTVSNFVTVGTDNEGLFGYCSSATIMNVGVVGARVTGWRAGAVAGYALTSNVIACFAKDCVITGSTTNSVALTSGTVYIAPVASPQGGVIRDCYAVGCTLVDATDLTVNTSPVGGTDTQNGYYCDITYSGTFDSVRNSTQVTAAQLKSGEVTYLLNKGITDGTQSWYQTCGTGLPAHSGKTVYQITEDDGTVSYANDPAGIEDPAPVKPEAPAIEFCYSQKQDSVRVQWTLVDGADGYQLYRSTSPDGSTGWSCVKTITDGKKNTYTNQGLTEGTTYYYKVRAYVEGSDGRIYSDFSEVKFMPAAVVWNAPYSNSSFRIRLRWEQVGGAHGYQIWRMDENGEYRVVKTIGDRGNELTNDQGSTTAYSNVDLTAGARYTYKMRAFYITGDGGKVFGPFSDEVTVAVQPEAPSLTVTSPKAGRAQIGWEAVNGASGYQVWMSEDPDTGFAITKSIVSGDTTSYTKYDLESGKTYYFKLRAYVEVDGKKTFGAYTDTIAVTVE